MNLDKSLPGNESSGLNSLIFFVEGEKEIDLGTQFDLQPSVNCDKKESSSLNISFRGMIDV